MKVVVWDNVRKENVVYEFPDSQAADEPAVDTKQAPSVDDLQKRIATLESELAKVKATAEEAKATSQAASAAVAKAAAGAEMK